MPLMEWTIVRLVVSENDGRRHNSEMELQGRTIETPFRTRRQNKTPLPAEDHSQGKSARSNSWAECREKMIGFEPKGEVFLLTFPLIGPYRLSDNQALEH